MLPPPSELERRARVIAALDMLLEPERALRTFDFDGRWARGQRVFSVRTGEGDHAFAWFGAGGAVVRGKHSGRKAIPDVELFAGLPRALAAAKVEPAFQLGGDSFATWAPKGSNAWQSARDPLKGGMGDLFRVADGDPGSFLRYARSYHGVRLDPAKLLLLYDERTSAPNSLEALLPSRAGRKATPTDAAAPLGDAEFKVVLDGHATMLVVGGKVQLKAARKGLYDEVIEQVRIALRAAGAK